MGKGKHIPSQNQRILEYMNEFGSITHLEAVRDLGVLRLASRVSDLRRLGYLIVSDWVEVRNRWGEKTRVKSYRLEQEDGRSAMD